MTPNIKYISSAGLLILIIGLGAYYLGKNSQTTEVTEKNNTLATTTTSQPTTTTATTKPVSSTPGTKTGVKTIALDSGNTSSFRSYGSAEYDFTIKFPSYVQTQNAFSTFHEVGNNWRLYASPANQGKGILELSIFSIDQGVYSTGKQKYPLYFTALVRVSASPNVKECYTPDTGYTNQKITNVTINGVSFKKFSTQDAATMKYVQAESYRTVHNNMCYVLEQIKNGSNYRDEKMAPGIADSTLSDYYNSGETIIRTFKFTK
jgi:hypothetical protein